MKTTAADRISEWKGRIVDVRSLNEFAAERLPGAECVPLSTLPGAAQSWNRDEPLLVMCKSGMRSRQGYDQLVAAGFTDVTMLTGGIEACKRAGVDVIVVRKTIPIIRQVLIIAGLLLLGGLVLSAWNPGFLLVTWFVTAGLLLAGFTGYCPMAKLLELMPWNKAPQAKDACGCDGMVQQG
jgi:rhodanese-related sulfurtransferase